MSKVGQWRMRLQENPAYQEGWDAFEANIGKDANPFKLAWSDEHLAWDCGWDDAFWESQPDPSGDEE